MTEQEFFTVNSTLTINVELLPEHDLLPSLEAFEAEIPAPFIVASEFSQLDQLAESARLELKNSDLKKRHQPAGCAKFETQSAIELYAIAARPRKPSFQNHPFWCQSGFLFVHRHYGDWPLHSRETVS